MQNGMLKLPRAGSDRHWLFHLVALVVALATAAMITVAPMLGLLVVAVAVVLALGFSLRQSGLFHPMWVFAGIAVILPLNGIRPTEGVSIGDIALVGLGLLLIPFIRRAQPHPVVMIVFLGTLLVISGGLIGMAASQDWGSWVQLGKFVAGAPTVMIIVVLMSPTPPQARMLLLAYSVGAVISSIAGMSGRNDPVMQRAMGFGAHLGHLGLAAMFAIFLLLGALIQTSSWFWRVVLAVGIVICFYGMLLTGMRSAVIGLILGMGFIAGCARWRGFAYLSGIGVAGVLVLLALIPYLPESENLARIVGGGDNRGLVGVSNSQHEEVLVESLRLIGDHPWTGIGFGEGQEAHNLFLQTLNIGGPLSLIGVCLVWAVITLLVIDRVQHGMTRETAFSTCALGGLIGYFVIAQFQPIIWDRHLWFVITLTLMLAGASATRITGGGEDRGTDESDDPDDTVDPAPSGAPRRLGGQGALAGPARAPRGPGRRDDAPVVPPTP